MRELSRQVGRLCLFALIGALASIVLTLPLIGFNILSASIDRTQITAHVEEAFAEEDLVFENFLRTNTHLGSHQFNDCLILMQLVDDRSPAVQRALSPLSWSAQGTGSNLPQNASGSMCEKLHDFVDGTNVPAVEDKEPYHRYLHGHTALAGVALSILPLNLVRHLFSFVMCIAVVGLVVAAIHRAASAATQQTLVRSLDVATVGIGLMLFFGLQYFSPSLSHFPSDIILVGYMACVLLFDFSTWKLWRLAALHGAFGVLTAYFEFLTGGIPLGLSLIFIGFAAHGLRDPSYDALSRALGAATAFVTGVVGAFVTKLAMTVAVFGPAVITEFLYGLARRTVGDESTGSVYPWDAARAIAIGAYDVGSGWWALGFLMLAASSLIFVYTLFRVWQTRKSGAPDSRIILLILGALSVYLWWAVFSQHTVQHFFFMARIGVGPIIASALLAATMFHKPLVASLRHALRFGPPAPKLQEEQPS